MLILSFTSFLMKLFAPIKMRNPNIILAYRSRNSEEKKSLVELVETSILVITTSPGAKIKNIRAHNRTILFEVLCLFITRTSTIELTKTGINAFKCNEVIKA